MFINHKRISNVLAKYNVNLSRLVKFLQDKQIPIEIIGNVLSEVIQELEKDKQWYKEPLMYPPNYRKHMQEFPEDFWIDNYILERCRMCLDELISGKVIFQEDSTAFKLLENEIYQLNFKIKSLMRDMDILIASTTRPSWLWRLWMRLNKPIWSRQTWIWTRNGWCWKEKPKKEKKRKWTRSRL